MLVVIISLVMILGRLSSCSNNTINYIISNNNTIHYDISINKINCEITYRTIVNTYQR